VAFKNQDNIKIKFVLRKIIW